MREVFLRSYMMIISAFCSGRRAAQLHGCRERCLLMFTSLFGLRSADVIYRYFDAWRLLAYAKLPILLFTPSTEVAAPMLATASFELIRCLLLLLFM